MRKQKRAESMLQKRLGSSEDAPKIVGLLSLSSNCSVDIDDMFEKILSETSWHTEVAGGAITHAHFAKHKTKCSFIRQSAASQQLDLFAALDVAKVADIMLFVVRVDTAIQLQEDLIDDRGQTLLSALKAVGCPEVVCCLQGLDNLSGKRLVEAKQFSQRQLEAAFGPTVRILEAARPETMCRLLCNVTPRVIAWKASRSFMVGEDVHVLPQKQSATSPSSCSAQISGYLRGKPLPINSLVHIVGVGTCRVDRISSGRDPFPGGGRRKEKRGKGSMSVDQGEQLDEGEEEVVANPDAQDALSMEAEVDPLAGEQTWPTEEEMDAAMRQLDEGAGRHRRNIPVTIPEGMSSYQADWFVDEKGEWDEDETQGGAAAAAEGVGEGEAPDLVPFPAGGAEEEDDETFTMAGSMIDAPFAAGKGHAEKQRLRALANNDQQFPDEMDTPDDRAARERFAKYRALQSFRSSPWHPKENLPREYSRIFQFENFAGVQRRVLAKAKAADALLEQSLEGGAGLSFSGSLPLGNGGVNGGEDEEDAMEDAEGAGMEEFVFPGQYVHLVVDGLSVVQAQQLAQMKSAAVFALHQHENRLSVLHFNLRRCGGFQEPIKAKEPLVFQAGFRSFTCNPIFSEANLNCDKHKLERFLLPDRFSVATTFAPITFLPCPLLVFKKLDSGELVLVATGSLGSVDPDRIILKKVILTGLPVRVRKRFGVVKHLFYDPQDVRWFKPAELVTKFGLRGHIREPVGTHGLLKAIFSGPITQNDTVMLVLFKRVFPKLPEGGQEMAIL